MIVVLVQFTVKLFQFLAVSRKRDLGGESEYQIQNRHLHHTLVEVCGSIFDDFDRHYFLRLQILTFHNLTERPLAENVQYQVPVPVDSQLLIQDSTMKKAPKHTCVRLPRSLVYHSHKVCNRYRHCRSHHF